MAGALCTLTLPPAPLSFSKCLRLATLSLQRPVKDGRRGGRIGLRVEGVRRLGGVQVAGEEVGGVLVLAVGQAGEERAGEEEGGGVPREIALD